MSFRLAIEPTLVNTLPRRGLQRSLQSVFDALVPHAFDGHSSTSQGFHNLRIGQAGTPFLLIRQQHNASPYKLLRGRLARRYQFLQIQTFVLRQRDAISLLHDTLLGIENCSAIYNAKRIPSITL
jgi:hypothetical protein